MILLLDVDPNSAASKMGHVVGIIVGLATVLSVFAFCVVAVVKAFTRRTVGWIVAGSFGGILLLLFSVGFVAGFIRGFQNAARAHASAPPTATPAPVSNATQTIRGRDIPYQVVLPPGWEAKRGVNDFDLVASRRTLYFTVIAEEANLGSPETLLDFVQNKLRREASDVQFSTASPVKIDGHDWLEFTVKCRLNDVPFAYQCAVYAGPEGSYQLMGWTFQNLFDREVGTLRSLDATFRFPPATTAPPPTSASPTAAPSQVLSGGDLKYQLTVPDDWMVKRKVGIIDLEVSHHALYVGVVAEEGSVGTPAAALKAVQSNLRSKATELQMGEASPIKIDGRDWLQFIARCKIDGYPIVYHYFVYAGAEGSYHILGWTMQNLYEREAAQINDVATTFRFPPGAPTATPAPPSASPKPTPARPRRK